MATVLDSIKRYQYIIDKHSHDEHKVLKCINKLYHLDVTVQHLQDTGVGRTINSLRKESGDVGPAARSLVQKWKEMVAAEESEEDRYQSHETTTYNGHGSGRDSDDNGRNDTRSSTTNATLKINGNHSGTKREYHSSEEEESNMKRSKYSYDDYNKVSKTKKEEAGKSKQDEPQKASRKEPEYDSRESEVSASDESDSSESSVEYSKTKKTDKKESLNHCKSSKQQTYHNNDSEKRDSSSSKKSHHNEKHSEYHSSTSKERHSSEKSLSKEKSHRQDKESSHKHKKPDDKIVIPEKKQKSDYKSSDHKISSKESKSSSKHKMEDHRSYKQDSSEKHQSSSEKHSSKSDKHRSSSQLQNTEKERHKQAEAEIYKHKSKDSHSSSSKEKSSSSSKEKSKDKNYSSKDKSGSSSSHKLTSDSKSSSSEHKSKSDKYESRSSDKKSKHKSRSSDHKTEKSSSAAQENVPKKKDSENHEDSDDGIDCGSGASFAEALGMISPAKLKKKLPQIKDIQSPNSSFSNDLSPAALLAPTAKLAPLPALEITALPEISPNYRPRPPPKALLHFTDDEALNAGISSKNQRTKVYSGNKVLGKITSLYEMCVHILQEHIDALEFTGGVPYNILKPVVDRATPQQLFTLEHYNPYLMEDTDHLWQKFCEKSFRNKQRHEMESWREMYLRCQEEQEHRLKALTANIRITQEAKKAPIKQTKMAYVDTVVKPPRNIARKQAQHGTAHASTASPAARVASLASAPNVARAGAVRPSPVASAPSSSSHKPKKAPLMQKALQFMRGRKR